MIWLAILILTIGISIFFIIKMYNKLIRLKQEADTAFESIEKNFNKRFDIVPNLLNTVKDTMKYEDKIMLEITNAKNDYINSISVEDKSRASITLENSVNSIFTLSEAYPELSLDDNFLKLQENFSATEDDFEYSIKSYNDAVEAYNNAIVAFPNIAVAHIFNLKKISFFK